MSSKILLMVSLAVCSLSIDAKALTTKVAYCVATMGLCHVECDAGMVVVGGGCENVPWTVGISASFPSGSGQWSCRATTAVSYMKVFAICDGARRARRGRAG